MVREFGNIIVVGDPVDEGAFEQTQNCAKIADYALQLADSHAGYGVCIGGVLVSKDKLFPAAVGYDIACGLKAVRLDADPNFVKENISLIMDQVFSEISFGVGRINQDKDIDHPVFYSDLWNMDSVKDLKDLARSQLGTVGSGNHFTSLFEDEAGNIWVGCHFGSRGLGHKTATYFMEQSGAKDGELATLKDSSYIGQDYLQAIKLSGEYAYAGRDWVCDKLKKIIGANAIEEVHLHHNFLWRETHNGEQYWVGRKGSTPAFPGQKGLIAASMTEPCVIFEGVDSELSKKLFYSTIHGAGRVMSRTKAAGKMNYKTRTRMGGEISREMMMDLVTKAGVELRGAGCDESPHVYKRIEEVLAHHEGTIKILHTLKPLGSAMAPDGIADPYKD